MAKMDELFVEFPADARDGGMIHPNFNIIRTPTGHNIVLDDTEGHESVTVQHAGGSCIQFLPDGSTIFRSEKDNYEVIFGNRTAVITGKLNIVVNGDADMRVMGDHNLTVHGDMNLAVGGDLKTVVGGTAWTTIAKDRNEDLGGSDTSFVNGNLEKTSIGNSYYGAYSDIKIQSAFTSVGIQANNDVRMWAGSAGGHACPDDPNRGNIYIESNASTFIKAGKYLIGSSFNKLTLKSTNYVAIDGADIFLNSEMSVEAEKTAPDPEH
jgi:hypothetical protein